MLQVMMQYLLFKYMNEFKYPLQFTDLIVARYKVITFV